MSIIYEPAGRAREYAGLAANIYDGCTHGCVYCWAPKVRYKTPEEFHETAIPRKDVLTKLAADCRNTRISREHPVLLCFTGDPYPPEEEQNGVTREAIELLHGGGFSVEVLTKGGKRCQRDFDLLTARDAVAATLTFVSEQKSREWEPFATPPAERFAALDEAHSKGIRTWASLEPVIDPEETYEIIRQTHGFIDRYKVGTLNYHAAGKEIDWINFANKVTALLEAHGCDYYVKNDLKKYLT